MSLSVNGDVLPISHLGPDFLILRNPIEHAPANGEIFLSIDGDESRWMVHLVNGIHPDRLKTAIVPCLNGKGDSLGGRGSSEN